MGITVHEALLLPALKEAVLVAGKAGVDRVIASVNMMEVPDILNFVKKDEFIVTTTYPIRDNPEAQERLIPNLVNKGVAALAIKPVFYSDEIPPLMVRQAEDLGFPLIQLPKNASFNEILNPVLGEILNRQATVLHRNEEVHTRFMELVLKGGTLGDIAALLATLQKNPVSIHTPRLVLLGFGVPGTESKRESFKRAEELCQDANALAGLIGNREGRMTLSEGAAKFEILVHHMVAAGEDYGFLILWLEREQDYEINVIEQAVTVIALEIMKLRAITEVERRFKSFFIEEIIQGKLKSRAEVVSRGRAYGWDLSAEFLPILIEIEDYLDFVIMRNPQYDPVKIQKRFWNTVSKSMMFHTNGGIAVDIGARILILLKTDPEDPKRKSNDLAEKIVGKIQEEMSQDKPLVITAGIGRIVRDILCLNEGYTHAERALEIGQTVYGSGSITHYDNLGIYRLMDLKSGSGESARFSKELLGELETSDELYHTDLLKTLKTLFECNFNLKKTADTLSVHYNTIRYRVAKIEQLARVSLDSEEDRLNLQLAFKVHRVLKSAPGD
jgi:purine catabolism regulator